jgi:tripartite-type tricarboxylate transporter receptor subunit TctC
MEGRRDFLKFLGIGGGMVILDGVRPLLALTKDTYPSDHVTWIIPIKPGGGMDLVARTVSHYLEKHLKEASKGGRGGDIQCKNMPEAGGRKAYSTIFYAKPDGYTIGDFNSAFITDNISDKIEFDCSQYTFLVRMGASVRIIVANKKKGVRSWAEMMKAGRQKELKWAVGNYGRGHHVASILVKETAKVPARLVPFNGGPENINALLRGDVDMAILTEEAGKMLIDAGEFYVLTSIAETSQYPGVPSIAQLGYPELADTLKLERLVVGPPKIPKEICDVLISCFKKTFSDKDFLAQAAKVDFDPAPLYGPDAESLAKRLFKYYDEQEPILKKYLS